MNKTQLFSFFLISLAVNTVGSSMGALLPVNAARLGASAAQIGLYMAGVYIGLASGVLAAGWLSGRLKNRKTVLVAAGTLAAITFWGMGRTANMGQLAVLSVITTCLEGMQLATVSILVGLLAEPEKRGRIFGLLGSVASFGALLSGLAGGVVNRWGFPGLFTAAALVTLLPPLIATRIDEKAIPPARPRTVQHSTSEALFSRDFLFLFLSSVIAFATIAIFGLARSLEMAKTGATATAIMSTVMVGGLIALPLPLGMGWLSDRAGRKSILILCYAAGMASLLALAFSTRLWQVWVASALQAVMGTNLGIGQALVADMVPPEAFGAGMSLYSATMWIGLTVGSALAGAAIQRLGFSTALVLGALLVLLTAFLITPIRRPSSQPTVQPGS